MFKRLALIASALLISASAYAGNFEDGTYSSNVGYSIKPPEGWTRLDASNALGLKGHLPQNISVDAVKRIDVIFFPNVSKCDASLKGDDARIESNKAKKKGAELEKAPNEFTEELPDFVSSISVLVLNEEITEENAEKEQMSNALKEAIGDIKGDYAKIKSFSPAVETGDRGFVMRASMTVGSKKIKGEQHIISEDSKTYIVTCTYDPANDGDKSAFEKDKLCNKVARSLKIK